MSGQLQWTVKDALAFATTRDGLDRLDAQLLLLYALKQPLHSRSWLFAHDTDALPSGAFDRFTHLCQRRQQGEPVAYLVGEKEFFGITLQVTPDVLIPRPDTETLVDWALEIGDQWVASWASSATEMHPTTLRVLDCGTGSGAIALALKKNRPDWQVHALDASESALALAQTNAQRLALPVHFFQSNWFDQVKQAYHLVVSNPPYIAPNDPHLNQLQFEPISALQAPDGGLADLRALILQAPQHLVEGGCLLMEHGYDQAQQVRELLASRGFSHPKSRTDLAGIERCSGAMWLKRG